MHNVISPDAGWEAAVSTAVMGEGGARACEPRRRGNGACDADAARRARARACAEKTRRQTKSQTQQLQPCHHLQTLLYSTRAPFERRAKT